MSVASMIRADRAYQSGDLGWYVVNHVTDRAMAGPFTQRAEAEADRNVRNERWARSVAQADDLVIVRHA